MNITISEGDTVWCPHCEKEFHIGELSEDEWDDADRYFEHVSTCDGDGDWFEEEWENETM